MGKPYFVSEGACTVDLLEQSCTVSIEPASDGIEVVVRGHHPVVSEEPPIELGRLKVSLEAILAKWRS